MPWAKVHKSVATKRKENREKSARHYARHRAEILSRKKAARDRKAKREGRFGSEARGKGRILDSSGSTKIQTAQTSRGIESQLRHLSDTLASHTEGNPVAFLERLYHQYITQRLTGETGARLMLESSESQINSLVTSCYKLESQVLQEKGAHEEHRQVQKFSKRVKCILDCILDMEMMDLDPDEDLERAYLNQRLQFQKPATQGWLNGTVSIPD